MLGMQYDTSVTKSFPRGPCKGKSRALGDCSRFKRHRFVTLASYACAVTQVDLELAGIDLIVLTFATFLRR
jgi:hypothetical protein